MPIYANKLTENLFILTDGAIPEPHKCNLHPFESLGNLRGKGEV